VQPSKIILGPVHASKITLDWPHGCMFTSAASALARAASAPAGS